MTGGVEVGRVVRRGASGATLGLGIACERLFGRLCDCRWWDDGVVFALWGMHDVQRKFLGSAWDWLLASAILSNFV